jgi:hypothetical protein
MRVRRSRGVGVRHIGVFGGKKLLQVEIAIRDIPTEGSCGPHPELVGDRWWNIGDQEKGSPESFDIRIRDPANPKIPTGNDGRWKSLSTCVPWSIDTSGVRKLEIPLVNIASSDFPIGRTLITEGRKSMIDPHQVSGNREA